MIKIHLYGERRIADFFRFDLCEKYGIKEV